MVCRLFTLKEGAVTKGGRFFGVGVGPGDHRLLTLRAVEVLGSVDEVVAPKPTAEGSSLALGIAGRYVSPAAAVRELVFPMTRQVDELRKSWGAAAVSIAESLAAQRDVAFVTLGDPMFYSTYLYLLRELRAVRPEAVVETVPGVSSVSALAAAGNMPLGHGDGSIAVLPARHLARLEGLLDQFETVVLVKIGDRLPRVVSELKRLGLEGVSTFGSHLGQPGEQAPVSVGQVSDEMSGYMSTIIINSGTQY